MTNRRKSNERIKNKKKPLNKRLKLYFEKFRLRTSDWLIITLSVLGVECLLLLGNSNVWNLLTNTSSIEGLFYSPLLPALIVIVFCVVFIYMAVLRRRINTYAIVIATVLSIVGFLFLFGLTPSEQRCSGLFGVMTSCSEVYRFQIHVLFLNPISLIIESLLAFTATLTLLMQKDGNLKR